MMPQLVSGDRTGRGILSLSIRLILATLFAVAAVPKLISPFSFAEDVAAYGLFPGWIVPLIAVVVPICEFLMAVGLLSPKMLSLSCLALTCLTLAYTALISWSLATGLEIPCGCFPWESRVSSASLARNAIILCLEGVLLWTCRQGDTARTALGMSSH